MAIRSLQTYSVALTAGVEATWSPPDGAASIEIAMDTVADVRMAFSSGGTANGQPYFVFNPDWWTEPSKELDLSTNHVFYFRCAVNNTLRIVVGIE
jgi:hypothetical protein